MTGGSPVPSVGLMLAALVNLSHPAHYVHWHFFEMSVANVVVIGLMIGVFWLAILLPFPRRHPTRSQPPPGLEP